MGLYMQEVLAEKEEEKRDKKIAPARNRTWISEATTQRLDH